MHRRTMRHTSTEEYAVTLRWDSRARYYVAEIPDIPTCAADGHTEADAIAALEATFALVKKAYADKELRLPKPTNAAW